MKLALLGATGAVGRTMLSVLDERGFEADVLVPLASARSAGTHVHWRGRDWTVREPAPGAFEHCTVALFSAGAERSRVWGPVAAAEGAVVVDNSSAWRMDPDVPLVVPEVNAGAAAAHPRGIIANPNCATIQLVVALHALRAVAPLTRVVATTFQSVSGAGQKGVDALRAELAGSRSATSPFATMIAGNVLPRIGPRAASGWNEEEDKIRNETRRILQLPSLAVAATCVRVPVEVGHAIAATVEFERPVEAEAARAALRSATGVAAADVDADPTPAAVAGTDIVHVGRLRRDPDRDDTLHLWIVADNLRKGAATNAVQIAELLRHG